MMLMEPAVSPYDWNFRLFGFQVRVSWLFWVMAFVWGYEQCNAFDLQAHYAKLESPGVAVLLVLWMASMFLSVLVHELGHAFAFRYFGIDSQIVLYHLGGLAIPRGSFSLRSRRRILDQRGQIFISAAGPAAQLALSLIATLLAMRFAIPSHTFLEEWLRKVITFQPAAPTSNLNVSIYTVVYFFSWFNLWWALLNLVPVLPLDGGRIAQNLIGMVQRDSGYLPAVWISIIVGFGVGIWSFNNGSTFFGILFVFLAISNVQSLQSGGGERPW